MSGGDPKYQERRGIEHAKEGRDPSPPKPQQSTWNLFDHRTSEEALEEHRSYLDGYNRTRSSIEHAERAKKK